MNLANKDLDNVISPFAYDNDFFVYMDKDEADKKKFVSFMTQRDAQYKTPAQEVYTKEGMMWESFRENIEPPTPQIKEIDGYKSEEEVSEDNG